MAMDGALAISYLEANRAFSECSTTMPRASRWPTNPPGKASAGTRARLPNGSYHGQPDARSAQPATMEAEFEDLSDTREADCVVSRLT
jgi:hypothetical protein